jgi:hypothetical protein
MSDILHPWRGIRRFERHGLVLFVAGTVYVLIGIAYLVSDPLPSRKEQLHYALNILDYNHWGYVFIGIGLLAILSSRWPPASETWGYQALTGQSVAWAGFYIAGILFHGAPWSGITGALLWGIIGFMWWAVSGLVNPRHLHKLANEVTALQQENLILHEKLAQLLEEKE